MARGISDIVRMRTQRDKTQGCGRFPDSGRTALLIKKESEREEAIVTKERIHDAIYEVLYR